MDCEIVYSRITEAPIKLIVLSHNFFDITKEFVSLLYQHNDLSLFDLVVVDNGSSPPTRQSLKDLLEIYANASLLLLKQNLGVAKGRNLGYKFLDGKSKFILFLDNDQMVFDGFLAHHLRILERGYDLIGVEAWKLSTTYLPRKQLKHLSESFSYVGGGGMLIRQTVINKIGLFDEQFTPAYYEDPDYNFRAYDFGFSIGWNIKAKLHHLGHKTLGQNPKVKQRCFLDSWKKFRDKWKHHPVPELFQVDLPEFHE
jgi:GT2 family glycosyltransferase